MLKSLHCALFLATQMVACLAFAQSHNISTPPIVDNTKVLNDLNAQLQTLKLVVDTIDAGKLSVKYKEGQNIEKGRALTLKHVEIAQKSVAAQLRDPGSLDAIATTIFSLMELDSGLNLFGSTLSGLVTTDDYGSQNMGLRWAEDLFKSQSELSSFEERLEARAHLTFMEADRILSSCSVTHAVAYP